jgi:hypothetical protein
MTLVLVLRWCWEQEQQGNQWHWMVSQGHKINPCNSMLHPAVKEAGILPEGEEEIAVQVAYTPKSQCFGCGKISQQDCMQLQYISCRSHKMQPCGS